MKTESGWLIERADTKNPGCVTGACLGITDQGKIQGAYYRPVWTTPDFALRFARKVDAEVAAKVLCDEKTVAVEHSWEVEPRLPRKADAECNTGDPAFIKDNR